jgi:Helix-turn-helix domain
MAEGAGNAAITFSSREVRVAETLKKGTRVTGADRAKLASDLKKRYDAGESIRSLAAATGRSYGFVHRILTENGVSLRGRGGATRGKARANR